MKSKEEETIAVRYRYHCNKAGVVNSLSVATHCFCTVDVVLSLSEIID